MAKSTKVGEVLIVLKAKTAEFSGKVESASKKFAGVLKGMTNPVQGISSLLTKIGGPAGAAIGALVAVASAAVALTDKYAKLIAQQNKLSVDIGVGVGTVQKYNEAFVQFGASSAEAEAGLRGFSRTLDDAQTGSLDAIDKFKQLGVAIEGSSKEEAFEQALKNISRMGSATERQAALYDLMGDAGAGYLGVVAEGEEAIDRALRQSWGLSDDVNNQFIETGKIFEQIKHDFGKIAEILARAILPSVHLLSKAFSYILWIDVKILDYLWSWKEVADSFVNSLIPFLGSQKQTIDQGVEGAKKIQKENEKNRKARLAVQAIEKTILEVGNQRLALLNKINAEHAGASQELKNEIYRTEAQKQNVEIQHKINQLALDRYALGNKQLQTLIKVNREYQLASKSQKVMLAIEQRRHDLAVGIQARREATVGGSFRRSVIDIAEEFGRGLITESERFALLNASENKKRAGLGLEITPNEQHAQRVYDLMADDYLAVDEKLRAIERSERQRTKDNESFLDGLGQIVTPQDEYLRKMDDLNYALEDKLVTPEQYGDIAANLYAQAFGDMHSRLAETLTAGTTETYERLAKFFSGTEQQNRDQFIERNTGLAANYLKSINGKIRNRTVEFQTL